MNLHLPLAAAPASPASSRTLRVPSHSAVLTAALIGCLLLPSATAAQTLLFVRADSPAYAGARAVATADFDRNGWPDLAIANTSRNGVTILLRRPDGFTRAFDVPVGAGPFDLATGDFNRDGRPDLAVANADGNSISTLQGTGNGSFVRRDFPAHSQSPRGIVTADVNNDGRPDLVYTAYATGAVQALVGDGAGGFTAGPAYAGGATNPQGIAAADFNHDGFIDVAIANASATGLRIVYGIGRTPITARTVPGDGYLNVLAAADFNADGWTDVAAASTAHSTVAVFLGTATDLVYDRTYGTGASPRGIAVADVNGDGALDVITANRGSSTVSVLLGDRAHRGAFAVALDVPAGSGSRDLVAADFDQDGRIDLVTGNEYSSAVSVLSNRTPFSRAAFAFTQRTLGPPSDVTAGGNAALAADFNRDGTLDVATRADEDPWTFSVLLTGAATVSLPGSDHPDRFNVADLDADGNPDIVYTSCCPGGTINAYLGDGRGGFTAAPRTGAPAQIHQFVIGDMNRDARPDFVSIGYAYAAQPAILQLMIGNGNGTFGPRAQVALDGAPSDVRIADVNRDGKPDVVVLFENGVLRVWRGDGAGDISASGRAVAFGDTTDGAYDVKLADLNHDGYLDAVVAGNAALGVALGSASGFRVVGYRPIVPWGWQSNIVAIADLTMDRNLDLVTAGGNLFPGNGDGSFGADEPFDYRAIGIDVIDFTKDGLPDILFGLSQGEVGVLVNRRTDVNRPPAVTAGADVTIPYIQQIYGDGPPFPFVQAIGRDPDLHALSFQWRDATGAIVSTGRALNIWRMLPGAYRYELTVTDGRGGLVTDSVVVTITPEKEVVLWMCSESVNAIGHWSAHYDDPTAAGNCRAHDDNLGAPKVVAPLAAPSSQVRLAFFADPTQTYKLWLRLKAERNQWDNDSVWVQFSGATDAAGVPQYRNRNDVGPGGEPRTVRQLRRLRVGLA